MRLTGSKAFALATSINLLLMSAGFAQDTQSENADSTIIYDGAFFEQYAPITVSDMLDRIPGIGLVLDTDTFGQSNSTRGLGASSQILIDGKRLAGKANEAKAQLDRISASEVQRIEIIRGTSSELDVQNSGQLVNIVLTQAQSRSNISAEVALNYYEDGTTEPDVSLALSGQRGKLDYVLSGSVASDYNHIDSVELSLHGDLSPNEIVRFDRYTEKTTYNLSSNLAYNFSDSNRLAINLLYRENDPPQKLLRSIADLNAAEPVISYEREAIAATASNWEIGSDFQHSFANGSKFKILMIVNERESRTTRERYLADSLAEVGSATENKNLFLDNSSRYREQIVRSSYTWSLAANQGIELGLERAKTTQDSALALGLAPAVDSSAYGGLTPVAIANANSTVEELRYEAFAVHNMTINSRLSLESSLVGEFSEISQSGDITNTRDFDFIKPKVDLRFDINQSLQLGLSVERQVSQLSFADFSAATNNRDEDQDTIAGNPELEPEQSWRYNLNLDYRLPNDGGVLNSRLFYIDVEDSIGKIDISPSQDVLRTTNGNVGSGEVLGLSLDASIRFGFIGLPEAVMSAGLLVQDSSIDDPLIGFERKVVPYDRGSFSLG
ncbi:MAG: hypothetical protein COC19_07975, partial [SAR86 cluster bacterium]